MTPENQLDMAKYGLSLLENMCEDWIKMNKEFDSPNTQTEAILEIVREIQASMR